MALAVFGVRKGIRDTVLLGAMGLAATAATGDLVFFLFFVSSHRIVRPMGNAVEIVSLLYLLFSFRKISADGWRALRPLLAPALLVFTVAVMFQSWTFGYEGLEKPLITPMSRFSHPLPGDNALPYVLLYSMMNLHPAIPRPIMADWLSSDRPPLQTAIALSHFSVLMVPIDVGYQMLSVLLQSMWISGLWLLLYALNIRGQALTCVLVAALFTNFVLVQSIFVWPKMMAVSYMLGFAALLLGGRLARTASFRGITLSTASALLAWAFLSHGGSLFALLGLLPVAFLFRRPSSLPKLGIVFAMAAVLFIPWTLYQKHLDPPGDRLLKMHLAGVFPVDPRPVGLAIRESYYGLTIGQLIANKASNFEFVFNHFEFWPNLRDMLVGHSRVKAAREINGSQFFHFGSTLGFLLLGLPALLVGLLRRYRSDEWHAAAICWSFVFIANVVWCLVMFGPASTMVHQGTYVTVILAFAGGLLGLWSVSRWLAYAVTGLQVLLFGVIHVAMLAPENGVLHYGPAALAAVGLVGTGFLFYRVAIESPQLSDTISGTGRRRELLWK